MGKRPCDKTNGMKDPQLIPEEGIKVTGAKNDPKNIRPDTKEPLKSDQPEMVVTTEISKTKPVELGKIVPKKTKNVEKVKYEITRSPGGKPEPVTKDDVMPGSEPDKDGFFPPDKPVKFKRGTEVVEITTTFVKKPDKKTMKAKLNIHACFEEVTTRKYIVPLFHRLKMGKVDILKPEMCRIRASPHFYVPKMIRDNLYSEIIKSWQIGRPRL